MSPSESRRRRGNNGLLRRNRLETLLKLDDAAGQAAWLPRTCETLSASSPTCDLRAAWASSVVWNHAAAASDAPRIEPPPSSAALPTPVGTSTGFSVQPRGTKREAASRLEAVRRRVLARVREQPGVSGAD